MEALKARVELERLLLENLIPFWEERALDTSSGGYHLNHDRRGVDGGPARKRAVAQFRTLWFFSALARCQYGTDRHREIAEHGYAFARRALFDDEMGGVFWEVAGDGSRPIDAGKHLYGQAQAVYGLCEYVLLTGCREARDRVREVVYQIERAHDDVHGGYHEAFDRCWRPLPPGCRTVLGSSAGRKLLNTHLHLLEAFLAFDEIDPGKRSKARISEVLDLLIAKAVRADPISCRRAFAPDWTPTNDRENSYVSYGHDVEFAWIALQAVRRLGRSSVEVAPVLAGLVDNALRFGYDQKRGGLYEAGPPGKPADRKDKLWWVQAEALVALLEVHQHNLPRSLDGSFAGTLEWILKRQADWRHGEWHQRIRPFLGATGLKSGPWKSPYHNGRALLRCLATLEESKGD